MERSSTYDVIKEMQFKTTVSYHYTPFRIVKIWNNWNTDNTKCWKIRALICCSVQFSSVQSLSCVWLFATPSTAACQASLSITNARSLLKHVHRVSDAIQPYHLLSSPSPPALNLSQHQGLFQWVSPSHQVARILEFQLQHQSFQWIFKVDFL